jgi:hypothetical protein
MTEPPVSDKFDRELKAIVGSRKRKKEEAAQEYAQHEADANQFINEFMQARTNVIDPALIDIAAALGKQEIAAQITPHAGGGVALRVALQDARLSRNAGLEGQPSVSFEPRPFTQSVKVARADQSTEVKLDKINLEFIEGEVMALVKKFIDSHKI